MNNKKLTIKGAFILAVQNHQKGNLNTAIRLYMKMLKANPNHTRAVNNLSSLMGDSKLEDITQIHMWVIYY